MQAVITASGAMNVTAKPFTHSWVQSRIVVTIPGKSADTIVVRAHQDSINSANGSSSTNRAPGADDDGSGQSSKLCGSSLAMHGSRAGNLPTQLSFTGILLKKLDYMEARRSSQTTRTRAELSKRCCNKCDRVCQERD